KRKMQECFYGVSEEIRMINYGITNRQQLLEEHWTKPISTKLKINVDGAIFESENRFGFGFIRDSTGKFVQAVSGSRLGVVSPEIAEVVGMKEVLSWIKTMRNVMWKLKPIL
uniref:RNase H type-1 domain-containing protein n=1 Tax=Cannabis sativa TaxID=3483 RepID=A0A803QSF3_CANSA